MVDEANNTGIDVEELQRCRCAECETERKRGCNSGRLKELIGNLFAGESSAGDLPGLFCRKVKSGRQPHGKEAECLCEECELATGQYGYYCLEKETPGP